MKKRAFAVNKEVFLLGIVSLFTDISSEMIFSVFSVFFTIILGASTALLGIIEGLADFSSCALDYVSGFISDKAGKRKKFAIFGYVFSTLAKAMLLVANSVVFASVFRVIERLGKSFRGPPRDAWIASVSNSNNRGLSFGIHKALDKAGAILGPFIAYWILGYFGNNSATFGLIFKIALAPALLSIVVLLFIKEKRAVPAKKKGIFKAYKEFGSGYNHYIYTALIFSLAYFSFGFLLLKAYEFGFSLQDVVLLYALFNISFVAVSPLAGKLGDYMGRRAIIASAYFTYFLMSIGFIFASSKAHIILLFVLFGIFFAIDDGQSKAYISDLEKERRGSAIGVYNFVTGIAYLPASAIAGVLWKLHSNYAFAFSAIISAAALIYFLSRKNEK